MSFFTKNPNGQTMTPSSPSPTRTTHTQSPSMIITGTSGKQYSLDNNTVNWVKSRYKQDMAGSYGLDDADQLAKRNGQLSASALKTYKNSNVDRQLAELGLPSEKNLEKYLESYNQWHTGGMDQYFSQMNLPKNYWTNVKGWYQSDMQNAYENTAEDQQRKARGLMPSKWEAKYTDTEIDDQLRARGLPPISEFNTYRDRWNNYTGIESLYANVAGAQTFLKLNGIKNDDTEYDDGNGGKVKGKDLYTAAFYDELERLDENDNQVYGSIMPLLKTGSGSGKSVELTGDYATDRANQLAANNKNATGSDDYAGYNAFSYDDYLSKADDYYGRYWKNAQYDDKQTVGQRLDVMTRDADEQAVKSYYDIDYTPSDVDAFIKRYEADYPNNSFEQMVTDMYENGVNEDTIRLAKSIKQKSATQNYSEDGKTGFFDYSNQFVRATEAQRKKNEGTTSFTAAAEASYEKEPSNVKEPELDGGWVFPDKEAEANAQKYKEVQAAADAYYTAEANNDRSALYDATQELRRLGLNTIEDADAWMRNGGATASEPAPAVVASPTAVKDYFTPVGISQDELGELTTEDAARIVEYYMEENGGWNSKNAADAFNYLRTIGVQDDTVTNTARDMQARYGNLPDVAEETAYEGIENDPAAVTQKGLDDMKASVEAAKERDGNDKAIIDQTKQAIQRLLFDEEGNNLILTNADSVIKAIDTVRNMAFTNPTAVDEALKQLGFSANGWFSGVADSLTNGWNTDELVKLRLALGENYSVDASPEEQIPDDARYIQDAFGLSDFWTGNPIASSKKTLRRDFDYALEWAQQQIASGTLTAGKAYNILAADGYQDEMEEYMPEEWHEAHFIEYTAPMLWNQSLAEDQLLWEEMTPEQRTDSAKLMWGNLTPEQKASMYKPGWWKFDDTVNRTPGQAWGQQAAAILPGLITQFVATPVTIADAIDAAITGRPEMWDLTQKLTATEEALANYGSVDEFSFGTRSAEWVTTAAQELFKMEILGNIGGMVGEAFTGTGVGSKVLKAAASDSKLVSKLADMLMGAVQASPFVAESFAGHYREAKMRGATNGEAAFYGALTGLSEGFIEGANFDKVWGKAIGADRIAENLLQGGLDYLKMGLNGKAFVSSLALGFLGEGTEELVGYAVETGTKMAFYDDTWAKGTEWSWAEAGEQALVGGILGALGSGLHGGSLTTERIITDYAMHNSDAFAQVFPDLTMAIGITESMPEGVRAKYEKGGATIMSETAYGQVLDQIANCDEGIRAAADEMKTIEAKLTKNVDTAQAEVDKLAAKLAPYVAKLQEGTLTGKEANEEYAPLQVKYEKAVGNLENAKKVADATQNEQWQQARTRRDNAESQRNTLQKQVQEHWAGIYYANYDNIISGLTDEMVSNIMKAYQKGAAYDPDEQAAKRAETAQTKLAEAEATETIEEAKETAEAPENAAVKARELAYDRVYKDHEAGKAYAEEGGKSDSKLTPVEFAENERQNFQAKTTAKLRRVTLELAGLEAKEGMSAKEIFEEAKKAMTPEAAQKLDMYQKLSKALGLNMVVRDVVAGTSGYVHDGKLYVTLNGKQSMLRVAAHELTHYMKGHAETQYDALRTSLVNEVGQEKFDELLAEKAQEYGLDLNDAKARLEADDEVCAELCEKMLENPDALERFVQSDLDAAKTLKQRLAKTLVAIKSAIRSIGTSNAETKADLIKQQDTIEQWYKGLSDAIDNANKAGKTTATTEAETATVTDTTTEAPQAPPVETNPDLFMGEESARREQLRSDLEALAKKGTKVQDVSRQEVNDVLDRVILGDKSNYNKADYAQIRGMLAQLIPEVTAYVNGDATVDANVLNERLNAAIDYMLERYGEGSEDYYWLRDLIPSKIALTDTAYKDLRAKDMTLRQASNELTKALGGKFVNFVYKKAPSYNNAMTIDELWQTITDQYGEQNGVGNIGEDALALIDYVRERADNRTSFNDLYGSQREDMVNTQVGEFLDAVQSMVEGKSTNKSEAARYTLDPVEPIEPTSDLWSKTATTAEAKEAFPDLWDVSSEESEDNNPTQRKSTESTYRKIYDILRKEGFSGKVLDASSGMGYGTRLGREEYGFDVDDIEPYPGKDYNPMYKDYSTLNEKYDAIISSAVLNVLPQDQRDALVVKMGKMLNPGGKMYITTRGTKGDVDNLAKTGKNIQLGPSEFVETVHGSYQKGFTNPELKAYLEDALGPGFTVEVSNKDNGGKFNNNTSIVVTKNGSDVLYALDDDYMPLAERYDAGLATDADVEEMRRDVDEAARDNGYTIKAYHGTTEDFTEFNRGTQGQNHDGYLEFGGGFYFTPDAGEAREWVSRGRSGMSGAATPKVMAVYLNPGRILGADDVVPGGADYLRSMWLPAADANFIANRAYRFINYLTEERGFSNTEVQDTLKALGFDAIDATFGQGKSGQYVVFDPEQIKSADPVTYDDNGDIIPLSERFRTDRTGDEAWKNRDTRWSVDDDLVNQYGAIEQGREPRARDVQVPRQSADNTRVSKFTRSIEESSKVTDAQAAEIASEIGSEADRVKQLWSYIPKSNDETMRKAKEFIAARQPATAQREFHDMVVAGKYGTRTAAIGLQLLSDASARDDWASVKDIAYDLRVLATEAGQSAQIFNVLKDLKGVGSAWYVEKLVNSLNSTYADEIASGQMDPITVSEEAMQKVREAKTQAEVDAAERIVADEIGPQLPLKRDEKLSNWRYLSMLGNPVTHIRNVTGNNLMHLMGGIKDVVASGIQRILEKTGVTDESDRAHARLTSADKSYWDDFAQKSYDEQKRNLQGGGKLGFQSLVQQSKRSFDNKVLDTIARGKDPGTMSERKGLVGLLQNIRNNGAMGMLEVEDAWGLEKNYKRSLMEYMKAQGYSLNNEGKVGKVGKDGSFTEITNEQMNKAIEWATNQAWTNTFRGPSALATELNKISKMNTASKLIVEGVMPFKKTPINIAKQGAMYSPAGIVVGTTELLTKVKQGKMSAATAIDHLSSGLTGTALMALGVVLAKAGILRGGGEDKKKLETYLEDTGDQTYAFKFGNVSINMSAIAPATIPLFMGVALQEMLSRNGEDEGVDLSTITDVLAGTLNPFMEMSFMSSLNSALKNYNNEGIGGALGSTIMTAAQNYGSQYLPTLGGKVAQFIDPTQRTTKSSATSPVGGNMDYYWRSLVKKVPGAEATLQPDVNIWGQTTTKDSFGDWALDFANKFILPTNIKVTNRDAVDNELIRVVESTGIADFLPSDGAKYFKVKGETYKMNASQYTEYSKDRGQAAYAALKDVMAGASYKTATDEQKAELLKKALDNAYKSVNNVWKEKLGAYDK